MWETRGSLTWGCLFDKIRLSLCENTLFYADLQGIMPGDSRAGGESSEDVCAETR